jgi:hypothetical protein
MSDIDDFDGFDPALPGGEMIEAVIAASGDNPDLDPAIRNLIARSTLYLLGQGAPDRTHVHVLRCEAPVGCTGPRITLVPAFTRCQFADEAIMRNLSWIHLEIWRVEGTEILANLAPDEYLGLNVWCGPAREFKLPPIARRPRAA